MKKIIVALDGLRLSEAAISYATAITKQNNAHLVGIFLDDFTYTSYNVYDLVVKQGVTEQGLKQYQVKDENTRAAAAAIFETACRTMGINHSIHHDRSIAFQELIHESMYADLLIIDSQESLSHYGEKPPTHFIRTLLAGTECPVLLVPHQYIPFEKICFLYDGGSSSVYAIKMFSYLLPSLSSLPAEVITAKGFYSDLHVPDNRLTKELMKRHYPQAMYTVLTGHTHTEIIQHLKKESANTLVVLGAYQRSAASRWLKQSMADILMQELHYPVFIAHNK